MISYLKGKYIDRTDEGSLIINVNGIGFEVFVPAELLGRASFNNDADLELYTYMQVKEDGMSLFGFATLDELSIFKKIISVSGIGPKGGISILSTLNREQFIMAVLDENSDLIAKAPGIGKKTAAKLVLELKDKFKLADALNGSISAADVAAAPASKADEGIISDAIAALVSLGYTSAESTKAVRAVQITEDMTVDRLLSLSLRNI
ncbi:MAG: Holliday junction branch migration protein RuvA [Lachnospiraceae bacterium]|jgi:Holliday junction DNA helicase RuvA|nr:Holliday junction branch migration protein RuvA [Lachnospiraceae bacterium]